MTIAAVILAGGQSSRFGRDKLAEPIDGRPLLTLAIDAVRPVVDEILVVAGPDGSPDHPDDARLVHDPRPFQGPLAGAAAGLAATTADLVLIVGGDMPGLVPAVLARLVAGLADATVDAVVLDADGTRRPLPMAVRRGPALAAADALLAAGERRLRSLRDGLALAIIPDAEWQRLDPAGRTLLDIDTLADL
jgi:molybdopterin-guanine dinucleotide biosynthesis protein A